MADVKFGFVEVQRGGELVPMLIRPSMIDGKLHYQFDQPESGIIY